MSNTLDEILRPWLEEAQSEYGTGHNDHKKRAFIEIETAKQQIQALITEARIDAVYSMHDSIMRGELQWGDIREDAWLNGTIHKWIDRVIESGDTTSTSHNGKWIQARLTNPTEAGEL
jgi:hypothetical protein